MAISPRFAIRTFSNMAGGEHNDPVMRAAAALIAVTASIAPAAPAHAALRFKPCGGFGYSCARLNVPLDRSGRVPGGISLAVKRIRALRAPRRGVTFALAGGPGQSGSDAFDGDAVGQIFPAVRNRDLIVFDQRGTGHSGLLRCRRLERANLLHASGPAADCARTLGPRRAFYTSQDSADDVEAIRRQLGVDRIAIYGTSYGTKVALAYALRYPAHVERMALDSVVEADGPQALYTDTFAAIPRALRALCRSGCARFTSDPVADVSTLVARLARRRLSGRVVDPSGHRRRGTLTREQLFSILLAGDFDPSLRAAFPGAVKAALRGDAAVLLRLKRRAFALDGEPPPPRSLSSGLYAATTCEEVRFPWRRETPPDPRQRMAQAGAAAAAQPDSAFYPFDRRTALGTDLLSLCDRWPNARAEPGNGPGPLPDVPVLLLEGQDDLRTPVENARRVAAGFPHASLLVAHATGHSVLGSDASSCSQRAFSAFFLGRPVNTHCRGARRDFRPTPPPPTSIRRVRPLGARGLRGRALGVLALTLRDVADDSLTAFILDATNFDLARGGGLRGGHYRLNGDGLVTLHQIQYVPGVRVSGRIARFGESKQHGLLHIGGRASPDGVLRLRGNRVHGRLGGRRVRARLRASLAARAAAAGLPAPR
jgi:pimeloyl-ACP methyl ester carboxylesterase